MSGYTVDWIVLSILHRKFEEGEEMLRAGKVEEALKIFEAVASFDTSVISDREARTRAEYIREQAKNRLDVLSQALQTHKEIERKRMEELRRAAENNPKLREELRKLGIEL